MVLEDLGASIGRALAGMAQHTVIDEAVLDECLKEICNSLLRADMDMKLVFQLRGAVKKNAGLADAAAGVDKRKLIERAVTDELCNLLGAQIPAEKEGGKPNLAFSGPKKGSPNVVMFVGLQGNGKTTTCMKYAHHYRRKGYKPALVCADTFRAGAFDQLKQNATRAQVPFFGSYTESDPAVIAAQGVSKFREEKRDLIIVDTSGRHAQSEQLFEEMRQVASDIKPDLVVFVMDGTIGQSAGDQAAAFKESVEVGAVIITKMDGSAKGGSTLSAVAATQSPVIFLGTGEHMDALEPFEVKTFVGKLLGKGDIKGLTEKLEQVMPEEKQEQFMETMAKGKFTMRFFREFIDNVGSMGPVSQMLKMMPMFSNMNLGAGSDAETTAKFRRYMTIMDSMSDSELDENDIRKLAEPSRIIRIAKGAGRHPVEVEELFANFKLMAKSASKLSAVTKKGFNPRNMNQSMANLTGAIPPQLLRQMGGAQGLQGLMKQMGGMPGMPKMPGM